MGKCVVLAWRGHSEPNGKSFAFHFIRYSNVKYAVTFQGPWYSTHDMFPIDVATSTRPLTIITDRSLRQIDTIPKSGPFQAAIPLDGKPRNYC